MVVPPLKLERMNQYFSFWSISIILTAIPYIARKSLEWNESASDSTSCIFLDDLSRDRDVRSLSSLSGEPAEAPKICIVTGRLETWGAEDGINWRCVTVHRGEPCSVRRACQQASRGSATVHVSYNSRRCWYPNFRRLIEYIRRMPRTVAPRKIMCRFKNERCIFIARYAGVVLREGAVDSILRVRVSGSMPPK